MEDGSMAGTNRSDFRIEGVFGCTIMGARSPVKKRPASTRLSCHRSCPTGMICVTAKAFSSPPEKGCVKDKTEKCFIQGEKNCVDYVFESNTI